VHNTTQLVAHNNAHLLRQPAESPLPTSRHDLCKNHQLARGPSSGRREGSRVGQFDDFNREDGLG